MQLAIKIINVTICYLYETNFDFFSKYNKQKGEIKNILIILPQFLLSSVKI